MEKAMEEQFLELKKYTNFEILDKFPFTIRRKDTKKIVRPCLSQGKYRVFLGNDDRPYLHQLIAQQFIKEYEEGDRVGFKNNEDKTNINLDNLEIIKVKNKKQMKINEEYKFTWNDVKDDIIDIKSDMNISQIIDACPFELTKRENVLELIRLMREVFAAVHSTPMIFIFKDFNKNGAKISYTTEAIAQQKLKKIIISRNGDKEITAWIFIKTMLIYLHLITLVFIVQIQKYLATSENMTLKKLKMLISILLISF